MGKMNNKTAFPNEFIMNNVPVTDKREIAESFNIYFANIGVRTSHNVPTTNKCFISFMPRSQINKMFIQYVASEDIISIVNKLKPKSSSGQDGISSKLMKATITNIINPITTIINQLLQTDQMKTAKVVPIYKSSDQSIKTNYRPISLLSAFSKILEKAMYNQLMGFLNINNIL